MTPELRGSDLATVTAQLGREPQTEFSVVARCGDGHPLVIRNHPLDREGKPFPTLFWLTCPTAVKAVARLEADGWIKRLKGRSDPQFGRALDEAHREYAEERARLLSEAHDWGGVGGTRGGLKCLHAHYANHLAGGADPVGRWVAEQVDPVHPDEVRSGRVAAVDMGTNSIRLLVGSPSDGDVLELARDLVITRLGRGVDRTGRFDPEALALTMRVLERYMRRALALGTQRIRVGATSAVRDVADRDTLVRYVAGLAGDELEILTGAREGELTFLGATTGLDRPSPFLVFDIGGGSTELVLGSNRSQSSTSVDLGSVRATERVRPADPPSPEDLRSMADLAAEALARAEAAVPRGRAVTLIGVAGTTTTVQALALGLPRYDADAIHGTVLTLETAQRVTEALARMTVAERAALPVMTPGREDVIVAGSVILLEILRRWGFQECVVSERDILDGLAIEMVREREGR